MCALLHGLNHLTRDVQLSLRSLNMRICSKDFSIVNCFHSQCRDPAWRCKYGASGVEGAVPSFKDFMATAEGQAELRTFVQRVDARVQQDWNKLPQHLRGGVLCNLHEVCLSCLWYELDMIFHLEARHHVVPDLSK